MNIKVKGRLCQGSRNIRAKRLGTPKRCNREKLFQVPVPVRESEKGHPERDSRTPEPHAARSRSKSLLYREGRGLPILGRGRQCVCGLYVRLRTHDPGLQPSQGGGSSGKAENKRQLLQPSLSPVGGTRRISCGSDPLGRLGRLREKRLGCHELCLSGGPGPHRQKEGRHGQGGLSRDRPMVQSVLRRNHRGGPGECADCSLQRHRRPQRAHKHQPGCGRSHYRYALSARFLPRPGNADRVLPGGTSRAMQDG
jgi:hypothetical protein